MLPLLELFSDLRCRMIVSGNRYCAECVLLNYRHLKRLDVREKYMDLSRKLNIY
jgi:hypothetical protein